MHCWWNSLGVARSCRNSKACDTLQQRGWWWPEALREDTATAHPGSATRPPGLRHLEAPATCRLPCRLQRTSLPTNHSPAPSLPLPSSPLQSQFGTKPCSTLYSEEHICRPLGTRSGILRCNSLFPLGETQDFSVPRICHCFIISQPLLFITALFFIPCLLRFNAS